MGRAKLVAGAALAVAVSPLVGASGCEAEARPQIVLSIDMDMPTFAQLDDHTSADAVVDTFRIEILDADNRPLAEGTKQLTIGSPADLPASFGVASSAAPSGRVTVRVRAFRAGLAVQGSFSGHVVLDPYADAVVDRLVTLDLPVEGIVRKKVVLHGDCIGTRGRFPTEDDGGATCVDASNMRGAPSDGLEDVSATASQDPPPASVAGTWALAHDVPCSGAAPEGTKCVPGGFFLMGDPAFVGLDSLTDSMPIRPIVVSPVYMDETEVTVGALRDLLAKGYLGPLPYGPTGTSLLSRCTWEDSTPGEVPLNCVEEEAAEAICARRKGRLPTEAEWEHAARGRGQRRQFVWGDDAPECCGLTIARSTAQSCSGPGPDTVGGHPGTAECAGDVSRDGVLDLNGNVSELVADIALPFDAACWKAVGDSAILVDPVCATGGSFRVARGAGWDTPIGNAPIAGRRTFGASQGYGFRCAFEDP